MNFISNNNNAELCNSSYNKLQHQNVLSDSGCMPAYSSEMRLPSPRVSVALCTCNGEKYLKEQLSSIAEQTRMPEEIIICDDNSSDSTNQILDSFAASVPFRVRIEHNMSRLGSTRNFEKAIRFCTGDLIALCDQDDIWNVDKLRVQVERFANNPEIGGVFSDAILVDTESNSIGKSLWETIDFRPTQQRQIQTGKAITVLLSHSIVTGATLMFRAKYIPLLYPFPSSWVHDGWIAWIIALYSKLDLIEEPLSSYRVHPFQQCGVLPTLLNRIIIRQCDASLKYIHTIHQLQDLCRYLEEKNEGKELNLISHINNKIRHLNTRVCLPKNRLFRLFHIIPQARNYSTYSKGWKSMLKDLIIRR